MGCGLRVGIRGPDGELLDPQEVEQMKLERILRGQVCVFVFLSYCLSGVICVVCRRMCQRK